MVRKVITIILTMILAISTNAIFVSAEGSETSTGTIGEITWTIDGGVLTFEGNGTLGASGSGRQKELNVFFSHSSEVQKIIIPEGITGFSIGFFDFENLTEVSLPEGIETIPGFEGCPKLESINIPKSVEYIEANAFYNCTALKSITLTNVTSIGASAFEGCSALTTVILPDNMDVFGGEIGTDRTGCLFYGCESLESITIPKGVVYIYNNTFDGCKSLKKVVLPDTVKTVHTEAFKGCTSIESIVIPKSVSSIADDAFMNCSADLIIDTPSTSRAFDIARYNDWKVDHSFGDWTVVTEATETTNGLKERTCANCGEKEQVTIPKTIPDKTVDDVVAEYDEKIADLDKRIAELEKENAELKKENTELMKEKSALTEKLAAAESKAETSTKYAVPIETVLTELKAGKKSFVANWSKPDSDITGYDIQYSMSKKFTSKNTTKTVSGSDTTSLTVKKLKAKKNYYVRIRTYKVINGKKYFSDWSASKKIKTK